MCLTEDELKDIRETKTAFRPFEEVTREVSAEKLVSISKMIPLTRLLMTSPADLSKSGNKIAGHLAYQCTRRFNNIEQNYPLAGSTWLDPRFKSLALKKKRIPG